MTILQNIYQARCFEAISDGFESGTPTLVAALPAMGKSYGVVKWAKETGNPVTVFAPRHDLYDEYKVYADEMGLRFLRLASFHYDCKTLSPADDVDNDGGARDAVLRRYEQGYSGKQIHENAPGWGLDLPCQRDGECGYLSRIAEQQDLSDYDVVVGYYTHGLKADANWIEGRYVAVDEFPGDGLIDEFGATEANNAIYLYINSDENYSGPGLKTLREAGDDSLRQNVRDYVRQKVRTLYGPTGERRAPPGENTEGLVLLHSFLSAEDLGNEWGFASPSKRERVAISPRNKFYVLTLPDFSRAKGVVALDGTPTESLWELLLGKLEIAYVEKDRWPEYIRDALGLRFVQTTGNSRPYMGLNGANVTPERDLVLIDEMGRREGQKPGIITSNTARKHHEKKLREFDIDISQLAGEQGHYNNLKGSNRFATTRVGIIIGCRHIGDEYIEKWAALMGQGVSRAEDSDGKVTKGNELHYNHEIGDELLLAMRENETLQAAMRFGRDGEGATVYIDTSAIPEWVERELQLWNIRPWDRGKHMGRRWTYEGIRSIPEWETSEWTTSELTERVRERFSEAAEKKRDTVRSQVYNNLRRLREDGLIDSYQLGQGSAHRWSNVSLHETGMFGYVR